MRHRSVSVRQRSLLTIVVVLSTVLLLNWLLPHFEPNWWLQPTTELWQCHTTVIRTEHGLSEGFVGYAGKVQGQLWLYSTTVIREVVCHTTEQLLQQQMSLDLQYRDVYLNVSHHDVAGEVERLLVLYPLSQSYPVWHYQSEELVFQLRPVLLRRLDRHGLTQESPLVFDRDDWPHWFVWLSLKLSLVLLTMGMFYSVRYVWQQHQKVTEPQELIDCSQW